MSAHAQALPRRCSAPLVLGSLLAVKLLLHLVLTQDYGYFRDEFYYLKLGERVLSGCTAMPLLAPLVMAFNRAVLGDSLLALHLWPALAGAGVIACAWSMTRELGGGLGAQLLAGACVLLAPVFLGANSTFSYDSFDQLFWALAFYVLVRLLKYDQPRLWLRFGLVAGLGLLTKESMLFLGFGVAVAFGLTPARRYYGSKWMWLGAGLSLLFFVPYLVMQARLDWPSLGYWGFYAQRKTYPVSPAQFLWFQLLTLNPFTAPVWLSGLYFCLKSEPGRPYRSLGWTYLVLLVLFIMVKAKFYFLAPAYPFLFAAGAVQLEQWVSLHHLRWAPRLYGALIAGSGLLLAPFALPLLPLPWFIKLARPSSGDLGVKQERLASGLLPQHFADRLGWENMAAQVTHVYEALPPADRARACIFTGNYGEAGAIEFFGRKMVAAFPPVLSGHGQYYFWGYGHCSGEVVIAVGSPRADLERVFVSVSEAGRIQCAYAMPYESNLPILVCRQPRYPLSELWPHLRHLD